MPPLKNNDFSAPSMTLERCMQGLDVQASQQPWRITVGGLWYDYGHEMQNCPKKSGIRGSGLFSQWQNQPCLQYDLTNKYLFLFSCNCYRLVSSACERRCHRYTLYACGFVHPIQEWSEQIHDSHFTMNKLTQCFKHYQNMCGHKSNYCIQENFFS